jgi:hypothetical protein
VFLVDSCYMIGSSNWNLMMNFTASIAQRLAIGSAANQVGFVKYGSTPSTIFDLNEYTSTSQVVNAILSNPFSGTGMTRSRYQLRGFNVIHHCQGNACKPYSAHHARSFRFP